MIPISIIIKLEEQWTCFYSSKRLGVNFKEFKCEISFYARLRNADGIPYNSKEDVRVTKIG